MKCLHQDSLILEKGINICAILLWSWGKLIRYPNISKLGLQFIYNIYSSFETISKFISIELTEVCKCNGLENIQLLNSIIQIDYEYIYA